MYRKVKIHFHQFCIVGGSWRVSSYSRRRNWGSSGGGGSQMFLWKSQAQDMGQLKFTMHWLMKIHNDFGPHADCIKKGVLPGHVWVL